MNRAAVTAALDLAKWHPLPGPDVVVGWRACGWDPARILQPGFLHEGTNGPRGFMSQNDVARMLLVSSTWVMRLRDGDDFAVPAVYIGPAQPDETSTGVYGWTSEAVYAWALRKGKVGPDGKILPPTRSGRPVGSGDPASLPRCLRPREGVKVAGRGLLCQAVRRKIGDVWLAACPYHLTDQEQEQARDLERALLHASLT